MTNRIFKRKIYDRLLRWKERSAGSTALLIEGARRVGKSTIACEFGRREYRSYICIDFSNAPAEVIAAFNQVYKPDRLFLLLQTYYDVVLYPRESLIIFDEVQFCPKARQAVKHLVADGRYDYIETGSLVSIRQNVKDILIPSEEEHMTMFPMDYEEFLWATGQETTMELIRNAFESLRPMGDAVNREMMRRFRLYMLVGGMPQAVDAYLEHNNFEAVDAVKRRIIELYMNDLRKIDPTGRMSRIFNTIPGSLAKGKLRFTAREIFENSSVAELGEVWFDLEESQTVNFCYRCTDPNVGMSLFRDSASFKLYMGDTGLFVTLAFWDKDVSENVIYKKLLSDKLEADLGYVYENVVAQMLRAAGHRLFYYTAPADPLGKKSYEVDFLLAKGAKIEPLEVKSSGYRAHRSLDFFAERYSGRITRPVVLYTKDIHNDGQTLYLPVYMTCLL